MEKWKTNKNEGENNDDNQIDEMKCKGYEMNGMKGV